MSEVIFNISFNIIQFYKVDFFLFTGALGNKTQTS